jgi:hypothetical protein
MKIEEIFKNGERIGAWVRCDYATQPVLVASHEWVGVDLDGTLAAAPTPEQTAKGILIGDPVSLMLEKVQAMLSAGVTVKIFTARACDPASIPMVATWLAAHGLGSLPITNQKDYDMAVAFDDRAIQIVFGTGMSVMETLLEKREGDTVS